MESNHKIMAMAIQSHRAREHRMAFYAGCIVGGVMMLFATAALAETVQLPIQARIYQCGTKYEALGQCKAGVEACCAFAPVEEPEALNAIEPAADIDHHGEQVTTEETDSGVIVNFE